MGNWNKAFESKNEKGYINSLIKHLKEGNYVFVLGPGCMGKTAIIKKAMDKLGKLSKNKCCYFDMKKEAEKGAHSFYNHILNKVSGEKKEIEWGTDLSNEFIALLDKSISRPTLLVFDSFRAVERDFYEHFSVDCRKIFTEGKLHPDSGLSKILMVFGGSFVSPERHEISPLWNITEQIEVLPPPEDEAREVIKAYFEGHKLPLSDELVRFVYDSTLRHRYLAHSLIQFIEKNRTQLNSTELQKVLDDFIDHVWQVLNEREYALGGDDKDLQEHFITIVEYLYTSPEILRIVIDLLEGKTVSCPPYTKIDNITITGAITKDKGYYTFSNPVYEKFLKKLLSGYRLGDFCLFHSQEKDLWKKTKKVYRKLLRKEDRKDKIESISPLKRYPISFVPKLVNILRTCGNYSEHIEEFGDMLSLVFDVQYWGVYRIEIREKKRGLGGQDTYFRDGCPDGKWINERDLEEQRKFVERVISDQEPILDWTGRWLAVPVIIREDFGRVFLAKIGRKKRYRTLIAFIQESLSVYYFQKSREGVQKELNDLKGMMYLPKGTPNKRYKQNIQHLWELSKPILSDLGISSFTLHEIFKDKRVISITSRAKVLSREDYSWLHLKNLPELEKAATTIENTKFYYIVDGTDTHFAGKLMESNNLIILEFSFPASRFKDIEKSLSDIFDLFFLAINQSVALNDTEKRFQLLKRTLLASEEYIYVIDRSRHIVFVNHKMEELAKSMGQTSTIEGEICHKALMGIDAPIDECLFDKVLQGGDIARVVRRLNVSDRELMLDTAFIPVRDESGDHVIAVIVFMHDLRGRQILWEAVEKMAKIDEIKEMETFILKTVKKFGFKRVFRFRPDMKEEGHFISEDFIGPVTCQDKGEKFRKGGRKFNSKHKEFLKDRVVVWCRRNTPKTGLKFFLEDRLRDSGFEFKENQSVPKYDPHKPKRPDFWVTLPVFSREGMVKLYLMDNWGDEKQDMEMISLDRLQMLETFARAAGQVMENARQREYLKRFQSMLSHGTMEPLQIMRLYLDRVIGQDDRTERKKLIDAADASLGMVQAALGSLLTVKRGHGRIQKDKIEINSLLKQQAGLFKAYAEESTSIDFNLVLPEETIFCYTDETVLLHILNNLVGNSIRHLQRLKTTDQRTGIKIKLEKQGEDVIISIKDNGNGLPDPVRNFFNKPFTHGMTYPTMGLGIGFSREMAEMLGGRLELIDNSPAETGTCFKLTLTAEG